jgi:hypothetical protein
MDVEIWWEICCDESLNTTLYALVTRPLSCTNELLLRVVIMGETKNGHRNFGGKSAAMISEILHQLLQLSLQPPP